MGRRGGPLRCAGIGVLALLGVAGTGGSMSRPGAASSPQDGGAGHVVVVGVAGLRWEDVTDRGTPNLARLAETGSVGTLSVRSAPAVTCPAEGWLTLGAGTYAATSDPGTIDPHQGCAARPIPPVRAAETSHAAARDRRSAEVPALPEMVELNRELRHGAEAGWLADQVGCVTAVGDGAALGAASGDGTVTHYVADLPGPPEAGRLLARCPVTLLDAGALADTAGRAADLRGLDDLLGRVRHALPPSSVLMVLGLAETDALQPRLHAAVVAGPGFGPGYLASASTHRVPYVQLADIAPSIVEILGRAFADTVAGRPFTGARGDRPEGLAAIRSQLADTDRRAVAQREVLGGFFGGLAAVVVLLATAVVAQHRRRPASGEPRATAGHGLPRLGRTVPRTKRARSPGLGAPGLRLSAVGLSAVPAATFLANLLPWWRAAAPGVAVTATVGCGAASILGVAVLASRSVEAGPRRVRAQVGMVAALTVAIFVVDGLAGSSLQIDSLLGYNPLVAGRFTGFGNIAFAVLGAGAVILGSLVAHGRPGGRALAAAAAVTMPVLVLDGWPGWGADFGGVLTLVPTFIVLALLVTRTRVTALRLTLAALAGAVVVGGIAGLDYLRPPSARTHFGRFVDTLIHGGGQGSDALAAIERKLLASWELLFTGPHTVAAVGLTAGLVVLVFRPPRLLRHAYQVHEVLRPLLYSTVVLALVGLATNDSGIAIPAVVTLVTGPATLALCAPTRVLDTRVPNV